MNPNLKDNISNELEFRRIKGRKLIVNFEGGRITSDAGIVWIAELDKKLKITAKFAECFQDYRHSSYVDHSLNQLLAQRVYGILLGYDDVNDHDKLRHGSGALRVAQFLLYKLL